MFKRPTPTQQVFLALVCSILFSAFVGYADLATASVVTVTTVLAKTFINLLQLVAIPLAFTSIVNGITSNKDTSNLTRTGLATVILYTLTTIFAVSLGLFIANIIQPGTFFSHLDIFKKIGGGIPSAPLVSEEAHSSSREALVPSNLFSLLSNNENLLIIILVAILISVAMLNLAPEHQKPLRDFFVATQELFIQIINYIMKLAPLGVFCIVTSQFVGFLENNMESAPTLFIVITVYVCTVLLGLGIMLFLFYPLVVATFTNTSYKEFIKTMYPAQLMAFTTASSMATLHKTNTQVAKLNVSKQIRSFVLSLGATVNMDGTALYQGVVILFIAQLFGHSMTLGDQFYVISYITLSSVGVAGIPGASLITLTLLLQKLVSMGALNSEEIAVVLALIYIPDRFLDMCRSVVNITGDGMVACLVQAYDNRGGNKEGK